MKPMKPSVPDCAVGRAAGLIETITFVEGDERGSIRRHLGRFLPNLAILKAAVPSDRP